ncbi:zinc finger protein 300 [Xenopus laevis]|uniref:Zinc finger protein 300 n=2 Tax=Xenopus laevis TaxID=8355 RepID=A0A1L8FG90_XENLA|nr:zinc finger protein 300 [Xenopus laevis]XP_018083396.1 zinc finger protein 300 [Xenopus laevis]OCT70605.1 hypothetical protein XELAEV_18037529mg [Xenopus laevis]
MAPTMDSREISKRNKIKGKMKTCTASVKRSPSPVMIEATTSIGFNEVAVYFSEEEWRNLELWQKELYSNVMREIHTTLISLGYTIDHPDVLCRIRKDQDPYISSLEEERKTSCFPSTSSSILSSDILCRIKPDDDSCSTNNESLMGDCSTKCSSVLSPDILFRIKYNEVPSCFEDENATETYPISEEPVSAQKLPNMKEIPPGFEGSLMENTTISVKEEDYNSDQENRDDDGKDDDEESANSKAGDLNQLIFNPNLSLWIKHVDEPSESQDLQNSCVGVDDSIRKEGNGTTASLKLPIQKTYFSNKENSNEDKLLFGQQNLPTVNRPESNTKGEESLLSIVLKRANAGSLYPPNYIYFNNYKCSEYIKGIPRIAEKETFCSTNVSSVQTSKSNEILSSFQSVKSMPGFQPIDEVDKPYRCNICEKTFKAIGILNVHMKTHTYVRPYQCNECGKSFRDNWNLKVHQKIHTGETPYKCTICEKGFIQYATYMKHQRIHTGEKPYVCCYCDKSFTNSSNLVRHHRTHTGEKPYICVECGKSFSYNTSLIQHKRVHKVDPVESGKTNSEKQ